MKIFIGEKNGWCQKVPEVARAKLCNEIDGQGEYVTDVSKFDKGMFVWSG